MIPNSDKLHLGCGLTTPRSWINLDGSWNAWFAKHPRLRRAIRAVPILPSSQLDIPWSPDILIHDVRKGLPFPDNSLSAIYSSHFLEHLYMREADALLEECFRVLRPGGVIRMVVPDLRAILSDYDGHAAATSNGDAPQADITVRKLLLRRQDPPRGNFIYRIYNSFNDFQIHKWMYDADSLAFHIRRAGFVDVGEMKYLESRIPQIEEIEHADRVLNGGLVVEGVKPSPHA